MNFVDYKINMQNKIFIKGVIGLPNETLEYKNNKLYINSKEINEDFLEKNKYTENLITNIPTDNYFVLGDNREDSYDSRFFGLVNKTEIIGIIKIKF